jgi:hypothetical protein
VTSGTGASAEAILDALSARLLELRLTDEVLEAVGVSEETLDNETGWTVPLE